MELMDAIKGRRSIRKYRDTPVREEDLLAVLEAARWAPSWANSQCWRFIVVRDAAVKAQLSEVLTDWNPARRAVKEAPLLIVACGQLGKSGYYHGAPSTQKGDWYMFDTGLAMQNLTLAAHALGLGTVHVGAFDDVKAAKMLGVPDDFRVIEMMPLGYPNVEAKAPPPRREVAEQLYYEHWASPRAD